VARHLFPDSIMLAAAQTQLGIAGPLRLAVFAIAGSPSNHSGFRLYHASTQAQVPPSICTCIVQLPRRRLKLHNMLEL